MLRCEQQTPSLIHAGDALYAMELSLSLEKLNFDKLLALWEVGTSAAGPVLAAGLWEVGSVGWVLL